MCSDEICRMFKGFSSSKPCKLASQGTVIEAYGSSLSNSTYSTYQLCVYMCSLIASV
jgi:hypothetical protein